MLKWRLVLTTLPFMVLLVGLKLGLERFLQIGGYIKFSDIAAILTGGIFLIGFMLSGTMADYKEAEKLPGELVCALEAIEEGLGHISRSKQNIQLTEVRSLVMDLYKSIEDWLYRRTKSDKVFENISALSTNAQTLDATALGVRVQNDLSSVRKMVTRIDVISRTDFLASGYALMDIVVGLVVLILLVVKFDTILSEVLLTSFVSFIYVYMNRLIRDIDDPFEYEDGAQQGAAEVELFPLVEYSQRLQSRLNQQ